MLNFSNTIKSKTIIILQIFILIFIGFYIKKKYFDILNDTFSPKIESFKNDSEEKPHIFFEKNIKDIKDSKSKNIIKKIKELIESYNNLEEIQDIEFPKKIEKQKYIELFKNIYENINKELEIQNKKDPKITDLIVKIKQIRDTIKSEIILLEKMDDIKEQQIFKLEYNNIFEEEKPFSLSCLLDLKNSENIYLFYRDDVSYEFTSNIEFIKNSSNNHNIILFEGDNFDGNFIILNDIQKKTNLIDFKSLKIVTKEYFNSTYLQNLANKKNEILLFTEPDNLGKCFRIKLQPNEIILDDQNKNDQNEKKRFVKFFENKSIKSIILPGDTKNQNDRTFRNIRLEITDENLKTKPFKKNNTDITPDIKLNSKSEYKILALYSNIDTKTAQKVLNENKQQIHKLKNELVKKIDEKIKKQASNKSLEQTIMNNLLDRIYNKITNYTSNMNYSKNN